MNVLEISYKDILKTQERLAAEDVTKLNSAQIKSYELAVDNWKLNGKVGRIPDPPGSYGIVFTEYPEYPGIKFPEIHFHPSIPVCEKYVEPPVSNVILTAVVGDVIPGYTPERYISLDTLPVGTQGYTKDGKLVTKVGTMTCFGRMVWYQ